MAPAAARMTDWGPLSGRRLPARVIVLGVVVTLAPLVLLIANRDWFFTPEGFLDPWQYVGFFRLYEDLDYSPQDYKLARLPWILLGYGITRSMPTMASAYVLHAIFLCATPLAFFGAMYTLLRRPVLAAVVALFLGFYTHAHGSGGWDYHNTPTSALFLTTLWLVVLPSSIRGSAVSLMLAGIAGGLTVHANVTTANLLPVLAYLHFEVSRSSTGRWPDRLVARTGWVVLGALVATVALGTINWIVGRPFVFFWPLLSIVLRSFVSSSASMAGRPLFDAGWVLTARHLALPVAIFIASAMWVAFTRGSRAADDRRVPRALIAQFLGVSLLWIAWQILGFTALDWDYMAYALIPTGFLALGGLLAPAWPALFERRWLATTVGTVVPLVAFLVVTVPGVWRLEAFVAPVILLAGSAVFLVPVGAYLWRPSVLTACVLIVAFAAGNRFASASFLSYAAGDPCKVQPAVYRAIVEAASDLIAIDPVYRRAHIWFAEGEMITPLPGCPVSLGSMGYSIKSMTSMSYIEPPHPMPGVGEVTEASIRQLQSPRALLAIITDQAETVEQWERQLAALGLTRTEVARVRVPVLDSGFTLRAWAVTATP